MVTKWKKWKAITSFTVFFISISLLLVNLKPLLKLALGYKTQWTNIKDAFEEDYQNTTEFRWAISDYLENFLGMANGGPVYWGTNWYGIAVEDANNSYSAESTEVLEGIGEDYFPFNAPSYEDFGDSWKNYEEQAKNFHETHKDDKNVLYTVTKNQKTVYTNAEGYSLDGPSGQLPEGYNFLLYFDGNQVKIVKDGKELDVYGDGYYDENEDWYVPGYKNFTVDEETKNSTVCIAVAKNPIVYVRGNYSSHGTEQWNRIYQIFQSQKENRSYYFNSGIQLLIGIGLFFLYLACRKEKATADRCISRGTRRIWFELKLLILFGIAGTFLMQIYSFFHYYTNYFYDYYEHYMFQEILQEYLYRAPRTIPLLVGFWLLYFFINDIRYNKQTWKNSLTYRFFLFMQTSQMRNPVQKKMVYFYSYSLVAEIILAVIALINLILYWNNSNRPAVGATILTLLFIVLLIGLQFLIAQKNRSEAFNIGALASQIEDIRNGNLTKDLTFPEDSDLASASKNLNVIQDGMNKAFEERMKNEQFKVELIANVSHDIKTPLTSIISYADLLNQEEDLPDHVKDYIRILNAKAKRLKTMVQDVFEVSKAASGQLPVNIEALDFGKLLRQTLADMEEVIAKSPVTVKSEIPDEPVFIMADGKRLYRVFQNLLQNALQYSLDGSRVYLSLEVQNGDAVASVKNTSKVEINLDKDFTDRFVRGDESRTDGGSGLGLSIANNFTEACGGQFQIQYIADLFVVTITFRRTDPNV